MRIAVIGSRSLYADIARYIPPGITELVSGGAKGIDTLAERWADVANAAFSFGETDKRTLSWQIQLNNAQAELNKMERELEANNKALDTVEKEFNEAEKQAGEFGNEVKKAAGQADDAGSRFEKLGGVLKGVGMAMGAAMAVIGTAAAGAGKALADMTVGSAAYADEILAQAFVTGMSTESLQAYKYAAELVDVSMETLTGSMAKQVRSMANARDGSEKFAKAYERLGKELLMRAEDTAALLEAAVKSGVYYGRITELGEFERLPAGYFKVSATLAKETEG